MAGYLAQLAAECAQAASRHNFTELAYIFEMARLEATHLQARIAITAGSAGCSTASGRPGGGAKR